MPLTLQRVDEPKEAIEAAGFPAVFGRSDEVDVYVGGRWASRRHCEIDEVDGRFLLRDLGSRHGTFVNGETVREVILNPGDEIGVGLNRFVVISTPMHRSREQRSATELEREAI